MGIFTVTKPFRMGYGDSFGFMLDVEVADDGYIAFGLCPPDWDMSQSLENVGAVSVRADGSFSTAERKGGWDRSQCHPLLNEGGTVYEPPLVLEAAPTPSPHISAGRTPSPKRPPRVAGKMLQDGRMPAPRLGRIALSIAPMNNNLWVKGNDYEVKVPSCRIEMGSSAVVAIEMQHARVAMVRAHDGCSLTEKFSDMGIKQSSVNDTRFVSGCLEGPKGYTTSPMNFSGVQSIERAQSWPGRF